VIFCQGTSYVNGPWDELLFWLKFQNNIKFRNIGQKESKIFNDGGYVILRGNRKMNNSAWGMIRFPRFKTRPSHADIFHLDIWHKGVNILRDGGSYSYAAPLKLHSYFKGTESHNTIQFDGRDQMPRLGRFLFGDWIKPSAVGELVQSDKGKSWAGAYGKFTMRLVAIRSLRYSVGALNRVIGRLMAVVALVQMSCLKYYQTSTLSEWKLLKAGSRATI
jgi:hypothetical protein